MNLKNELGKQIIQFFEKEYKIQKLVEHHTICDIDFRELLTMDSLDEVEMEMEIEDIIQKIYKDIKLTVKDNEFLEYRTINNILDHIISSKIVREK